MSDMLNSLSLNDVGHPVEAEEVSADERTIFLTFSKGYPISENEVREFFTRYDYIFVTYKFITKFSGLPNP